ncbi:MAG: tetratricopeptide repeat protein [Bacteroidota bacterium]
MKWVLWLGVVPLLYGLRLLWKWTFVDFRQWKQLTNDYRQGLPLRLLVAAALIAIGGYSSLEVFTFLDRRYNAADHAQEQQDRQEVFAALDSGDYEEAERLLTRITLERPDDASAWDMLGNVLLAMGKNDEALAAYDKAVSADPEYAHTYYDRGSLFLNADDYDRAIPDLRKAVELGPEYADFRTALGAALVSVSQFDEAIVHLEKAAQKDTEHATARLYLGIAYKRVGRDREAVEQFHWILDNHPDSFEAEQLRRAGFTD